MIKFYSCLYSLGKLYFPSLQAGFFSLSGAQTMRDLSRLCICQQRGARPSLGPVPALQVCCSCTLKSSSTRGGPVLFRISPSTFYSRLHSQEVISHCCAPWHIFISSFSTPPVVPAANKRPPVHPKERLPSLP